MDEEYLRERIETTQGRVALVIGGGGLTGAFFAVGALRALNDFLDSTQVTDFDLFVGTSSGAFIAACLANGISPEEMFRSLHREAGFLANLERAAFFHLNYREVLAKIRAFPRTWLALTRHYLANLEEMSYLDYLLSFSEVLPSGVLTNAALEQTFRKVFSQPPFSDRFEEVRKELYITAVDLDAAERVVFGSRHAPDIPISLSIRAASALPLVYRPVRIGDVDYVDGAIKRTLNVDIAIDRGASLVFVINPLMPLYNLNRSECVPLATGRSRHLADKGVSYVIDQVFRIAVDARMLYGLNVYRAEHPEVDIVLMQPEIDDAKVFFHRYYQYTHRLTLMEHGFKTARQAIMTDFDYWRRVFERNGIGLSPGLVEYESNVMSRARRTVYEVERALGGQAAVDGRVQALEDELGLYDDEDRQAAEQS